MPPIRDEGARAIRAGAQSIALQDLPEDDPSSESLAWHESLQDAGMKLELYEQKSRDQLRVFTICEQRCTSYKSEAHHPRFHQRVEDIQPEDFSSAARRTWRRPAAEPTVQANNRANSFLNRSVPSGHPGLTKAAAKVLENHENVLGATVKRMYKAQEQRMDKLSSSGSAGSPAVGQFSGLHLGGHDTRKNQTRDGRNGDPRRR